MVTIDTFLPLMLLILFPYPFRAGKGDTPVCGGNKDTDWSCNTGDCKKLMQDMASEDKASTWNYKHKALRVSFQKDKCQTVVEIGTARGGLAAYMLMELHNITSWHSIDPFAGGYDKTDATSDIIVQAERKYGKGNWKRSVIQRLGKFQCRYQLHLGLSSDRVNDFKNNSIDCLFIDGDHTKRGVKKDIELYAKKVRPGGSIYFDDVGEKFKGVREAAFELIVANNLTLEPVGKYDNYRVSVPIDVELNTSFQFDDDLVLPKPAV
jgi:predicted O-methyltransferase YrrM